MTPLTPNLPRARDVEGPIEKMWILSLEASASDDPRFLSSSSKRWTAEELVKATASMLLELTFLAASSSSLVGLTM